MVAVDSARPGVELISNGRRHVCSLGPRTEDPGSWKCSWCGHANVRQHAGFDHCSACNAETYTYFTWENEMGVRYSRRPTSLVRQSSAIQFQWIERRAATVNVINHIASR